MGRSWVFLASWHFRMIKPALAQPYEISSHTMKPGQALDRDAQERHSAFWAWKTRDRARSEAYIFLRVWLDFLRLLILKYALTCCAIVLQHVMCQEKVRLYLVVEHM